MDSIEEGLGSDDELLSSIEMPHEERRRSPVVVESSPFVYLSALQQEIRKNPTRKFLATIKVGTGVYFWM
jgi:hypothetical protein